VNLPLPPRPVRRLLIDPLFVVATTLLLAATPVIVLVLAFGVRFLPGRWRPLRLFWFLLVYLVRETLGIFALAFLWLASGFGRSLETDRFRRAHVALIGWYLRGLVDSASRVLGLRLVTEAVPDDLAVADRPVAGSPPRPVLVLSRHAGAGDSFILANLLVNTYRRRPRIVLKDLLQLDPCIDLVLNRLPSRFIRTGPPGTGSHGGSADVVGAITRLAADLEDDGALILFPEGGNFTEGRRRRAIERLAEGGFHDAVRRAHELTYVLPPRPGGAFAAIDAAPAADVLFVAHTGLEQLSGPRDLWHGLPMDREVRLTWWSVHRDEIPRDEAGRMI
jgi:1-acyl-sn-glycerol-3-phosphate acyltransferase